MESAKKKALQLLSKQNYSESEIKKRLINKGETPEAAEEVVTWLLQLGYLDDSNYATLIVNHYSDKGYGLNRIKAELTRRGIPREMWDEKLITLDDSEMEDRAVLYIKKKMRGSDDKDDLRRAMEALVRRGFSYDEARNATNRYLENI